MYRHHINNGMAPLFAQLREDFLSFIQAHKIISKNTLNILHTLFNYFFIIGTAILPKKELKNIGGYICPFLDFLRQVFADNLAIKVLAQLVLDYLTNTEARIEIFHLTFLLGSPHLKEVELIHGKCNVDLEFFPDRRLQAALVGND